MSHTVPARRVNLPSRVIIGVSLATAAAAAIVVLTSHPTSSRPAPVPATSGATP
jgi:hypothetical protein